MKRRIGLVLLAWIVVPWTAGTILDARRNRAAAAAEDGSADDVQDEGAADPIAADEDDAPDGDASPAAGADGDEARPVADAPGS